MKINPNNSKNNDKYTSSKIMERTASDATEPILTPVLILGAFISIQMRVFRSYDGARFQRNNLLDRSR